MSENPGNPSERSKKSRKPSDDDVARDSRPDDIEDDQITAAGGEKSEPAAAVEKDAPEPSKRGSDTKTEKVSTQANATPRVQPSPGRTSEKMRFHRRRRA